jgi:hypothetical protein
MFSFDLFKSPLKRGLTNVMISLFLQVGQVQSQVITDGSEQTADIFLKTEIVPEIPYVQAQFIYILRVYSQKKIVADQFPELNIEHANVQKLGRVLDGKVLEQRYAIFPENSGPLEIPSITFTGAINQYPAGSLDAIFNPPERIEQHFPSRQLDIQPKPSQFPDNAWWLPAQDFTLNEAWRFNSPHFKVGESVTLTLTMQAKGATQLPKLLPQNLDGIYFYPASPQLDKRFEDNWLITEKRQQINVVLKKPGNYTLAEMKIPWWDTINQQLRYAYLPARSIHVFAATEKEGQFSLIEVIHTHLWLLVSIGLAMTWLITLVVWWRQRPVSTTDLTQKRQNLRGARQALKRACVQNDPQQTKQALLEWAANRWRDIPMYNLGNIAAQLNDAEAKAGLRELDRVLYAPQELAWDGKAFWRLMSKNMGKASTGKVENSPLPDIYP